MTAGFAPRHRPQPVRAPQRPPRTRPAKVQAVLDSGASPLSLFMAVAGLSFVVGSLVTLQFAPIAPAGLAQGDSPEVTRSASGALDPLPVDPGVTAASLVVTAIVSTAVRKPVLAAVEVPSRQSTQIAAAAITHAGSGARVIGQSAAQSDAGSSAERADLAEETVRDLTLLDAVSAVEPAIAQDVEDVIAEVTTTAVASDEPRASLPEPEVQIIDGQRYYIVDQGDSLAYIALIFFGDTGAYQQIYEANRDILETPDHVEAGMRLRIPDA